MAKRYYWLKLPDNWFQQKTIKKLRKIAGGDTYTIIYLKMLLVAIKQEGKLYFEGVEENFYEELALDIDEEPENVRIALSYLSSQHLVELVETDEYSLPEAAKLTGSESASAERMRRLRERKASQCDIDVTQQLRMGDVEIEIEIDKRDINTVCTEQSSAPPPKAAKEQEEHKEVFIELPLNDKTMFAVTKDYVAEMKELYPAVDVEQQLRSMVGWCRSNPRRLKTRSGIKGFINRWLAKEQDRAPGGNRDQLPVKNNNRFNNFQGRDYDYGQLERDLLAAQNRQKD